MREWEIIRTGRIQGLNIFFDTMDYRTPHVHPEWELLWVLDAPLSVTCARETFQAEPGELLLFSPNMTHEFHRLEKSCTFLCVQVSPELLGTARAVAVDSLFPAQYLSAEELAALRRGLRESAAAYFAREDCYELFCIGQVCLVFHQLLTKMPCRPLSREDQASTDRRNERLTAFLRFVDENYMHKIRLSDFAAQQGCSLGYLSHFIKETLNQSFQDYVNAVRVNAACQQIAAGGKRMLEICLDAGFSDYRYFSKAFKAQFGMTPEQYSRQSSRPELEGTAIHRSLHSLERFYDEEQSRLLVRQLL